jgi:NAD(P)H-flavin reductase
MHTGKGQVLEMVLQDGFRRARIKCPAILIPSPGQYLLVSDGSDSPLADSVCYADSAPDGVATAPWRHFLAAPAPSSWHPGLELFLCGPLGRGFELPASARKVALVPFGGSAAPLLPLVSHALKHGAAVVLVGNSAFDHLPDEVEVQPLSALNEIAAWADWLALDVARENWDELRERVGNKNQSSVWSDAQVLIHTPVPCGGFAECGVCAVMTKSGWKMACKDGPVFRWEEI